MMHIVVNGMDKWVKPDYWITHQDVVDLAMPETRKFIYSITWRLVGKDQPRVSGTLMPNAQTRLYDDMVFNCHHTGNA